MDVSVFLDALGTDAPTTTSLGAVPTTTTEGGSVTLTATVTASPANGSDVGGDVTFAFQSYLTNGEPDLSWTLGTATITGGNTASGAASLASVSIPPGLVGPGTQAVDVVAMYGGDPAHLASTSSKVRIELAHVPLCITPASDDVAAGAKLTFTVGGRGRAGGVVRERVDTTCDTNELQLLDAEPKGRPVRSSQGRAPTVGSSCRRSTPRGPRPSAT